MAKQASKRTVSVGGGDRIDIRDINAPITYVDLIVESRLSDAGIVHLSLGSTVIDGEQDNFTVEAVVTHRLRMTSRTAQAIANQLNQLASSADAYKKTKN